MGFSTSISHLSNITTIESLTETIGWLWKRSLFENCSSKILAILFVRIIVLCSSCYQFQWSSMVITLMNSPGVRCQYLMAAVCKLYCDYIQLSNCLIYWCFADMFSATFVIADNSSFLFGLIIICLHLVCLMAAGGNNRWCVLCCCRAPQEKPLPC